MDIFALLGSASFGGLVLWFIQTTRDGIRKRREALGKIESERARLARGLRAWMEHARVLRHKLITLGQELPPEPDDPFVPSTD